MKKYFFYVTFLFILMSCSSDETNVTETPNEDDDEIIQELSLPELQTNEVTDISLYSANIGGKLINSGDSEIVEVGLVVGYNALPTIESNLNKFILTPDEFGNFNLRLLGIPANKTYHIRAYGINSDGVGYGNEVQFNSLSERVYEGNVILSTQEQVIAFGAINYTTINGSVDIYGDVTDLSPLESIVIVNYGFKVRSTNLQNLEGLNNLKITGNVIPGAFRIENNASLESLSGLNNLEVTRGSSIISNNVSLTNLEGLNSYTSVSSGSFYISGCLGLQSLSGLENLQFIGDSFNLQGNPLLNDISALSNLNYIDRSIYMNGNHALQNLNGLESITSLTSLTLEDNNNLINLDGIRNVTTISELINISYNDNLNDLSAFENINTVSTVIIIGNNSLVNLQGFNNLTAIVNLLDIYDNPSLTSLHGMENLTTLGRLRLNSNPSLINLEGLSSLTTINNGSSAITISDNASLNSLNGFESLIDVDGSIQIISNSTLSDFCALKNLFSNGGYTGYINFYGNLNNPTPEDIINNCD